MNTLIYSSKGILSIIISLILFWFDVIFASSFHVVIDDLSSYNVIGNFTTGTYTDCRMRCNVMTKCRDTFVTEEMGGLKRCLLLSRKMKKATDCKTSDNEPDQENQGTKASPDLCVVNKYYKGKLLDPIGKKFSSWEGCRQLCQDTKKCKKWSWHPENQSCNLKSWWRKLVEMPGYLSGKQHCNGF